MTQLPAKGNGRKLPSFWDFFLNWYSTLSQPKESINLRSQLSSGWVEIMLKLFEVLLLMEEIRRSPVKVGSLSYPIIYKILCMSGGAGFLQDYTYPPLYMRESPNQDCFGGINPYGVRLIGSIQCLPACHLVTWADLNHRLIHMLASLPKVSRFQATQSLHHPFWWVRSFCRLNISHNISHVEWLVLNMLHDWMTCMDPSLDDAKCSRNFGAFEASPHFVRVKCHGCSMSG